MLEKIGAKRNLLKQSIRREIGVLFLAPGILGAIHVIFGLEMFTVLMSNPYHDIWIPFLIFFVLYFVLLRLDYMAIHKYRFEKRKINEKKNPTVCGSTL